MSSPPWVPLLRAAVKSEWGEKACITILATVDKDHRPRARSVVCRTVQNNGILWFASDARSEKNKHVRSNPFGEAVFWLPTRREQFRVAGSLSVTIEATDRLKAWHTLTDTARALFFWDQPGAEVREDREFPGLVLGTTPMPDSFEVLILAPDRAEFLDLKEYPHRRSLWDSDTDWLVQSVNP